MCRFDRCCQLNVILSRIHWRECMWYHVHGTGYLWVVVSYVRRWYKCCYRLCACEKGRVCAVPCAGSRRELILTPQALLSPWGLHSHSRPLITHFKNADVHRHTWDTRHNLLVNTGQPFPPHLAVETLDLFLLHRFMLRAHQGADSCSQSVRSVDFEENSAQTYRKNVFAPTFCCSVRYFT